MSKSFDDVFRQFGAVFAIVASADGARWEEYGDRSALPYQGMVMRFFQGRDSVSALDEMLGAAVLPQTARQGALMAVLSRPLPGLVVGVFVLREGSKDPFANRRWAEGLDQAIAEVMT